MNTIYEISLPREMSGKELTRMISNYGFKQGSVAVQTPTSPNEQITKQGKGDFLLGLYSFNKNKNVLFLKDKLKKENMFALEESYNHLALTHTIWEYNDKSTSKIDPDKIEINLKKIALSLEKYIHEEYKNLQFN